jgi:hypothetical protein
MVAEEGHSGGQGRGQQTHHVLPSPYSFLSPFSIILNICDNQHSVMVSNT